MMVNSPHLVIRANSEIREGMDELVKNGHFPSLSEAIRQALVDFLFIHGIHVKNTVNTKYSRNRTVDHE
jgi:Arc/MetJ-type ribon-helix-helix transcriptional regulator